MSGPWFPPEIEPTQEGRYATRSTITGDEYLLYWNGEFWCNESVLIDDPDGEVTLSRYRGRPREWRKLLGSP